MKLPLSSDLEEASGAKVLFSFHHFIFVKQSTNYFSKWLRDLFYCASLTKLLRICTYKQLVFLRFNSVQILDKMESIYERKKLFKTPWMNKNLVSNCEIWPHRSKVFCLAALMLSSFWASTKWKPFWRILLWLWIISKPIHRSSHVYFLVISD